MSLVNPTKKPSFIEEDKELEFSKNGFIELKSFLDENLCGELLNSFNSYYKNKPANGMWFSSKHEGFENAIELSEEIRNKIEPLLHSIFKDFKVEIFTMIDKPLNTESYMGLHRDYSISDEKTFQYRNVWIPLVDVNKDNGSLFLIPESHKFDQPNRWGNIENSSINYSHLNDKKKIIECKKGNAIIYADRTLHGSLENKNSENRPVIHFGLVHNEVEYLIAKKDIDGKYKIESASLKELIHQK